jgi:hypothetical protein
MVGVKAFCWVRPQSGGMRAVLLQVLECGHTCMRAAAHVIIWPNVFAGAVGFANVNAVL